MSAVRRFQYVQGVGKRKHMLFGAPGTDTVCGAWYWGRSRTDGRIDPPRPGAAVCKHCLRLSTPGKGDILVERK